MGLFSKIANTGKNIGNAVVDTGAKAGTAVVDTSKDAVNTSGGFISNIFISIKKLFGSLFSILITIGIIILIGLILYYLVLPIFFTTKK